MSNTVKFSYILSEHIQILLITVKLVKYDQQKLIFSNKTIHNRQFSFAQKSEFYEFNCLLTYKRMVD